MILDYESERFAERARKLISSGQPFMIVIRGRARDALEAHLAGGRIVDPPKLGLTPSLQPVLGVLVFADGKERAVSIEQTDDAIQVAVSVGLA
jgi:hypothetical protein